MILWQEGFFTTELFGNTCFGNMKVVFNPLQLVAILLRTLLKPLIIQDGGQVIIQNISRNNQDMIRSIKLV